MFDEATSALLQVISLKHGKMSKLFIIKDLPLKQCKKDYRKSLDATDLHSFLSSGIMGSLRGLESVT